MGMTQTSTTPEDIARSLSPTMVATMLTGVIAGGLVVGKTNTMNALADRGLITDGHRRLDRRPSGWTKLGREVARVLDPSIMSLDELHAVALTEDAERSPERPTVVIREHDGELFSVDDHVTVQGIPGVTWLVTHVYPGDDSRSPAAMVWAPPATGYGPRLVEIGILAHVQQTTITETRQESAYPDPKLTSYVTNPAPQIPQTPTDYANALAARLMQAISEVTPPAPRPTADPVQTDVPDELLRRIVRRSQYLALREVLTQLDGLVGCDTLHPDDIRGMVNDAARQLNLPAIP